MTSQPKITVNDLDGLYSYLDTRMNKTYEQLKDSKHVEYGNNYVKSFILECDWDNKNSTLDEEKEYLQNLLTFVPKNKRQKRLDAIIYETAQKGFYIAEWLQKDTKLSLYIDTISDENRRFWRTYSTSKANLIDNTLEKLVNSKPNLDRIWLWSGFLRNIQKQGISRGFRFEHDDSIFKGEESNSYNNDGFNLNFSGSEEETENIFKLISENATKNSSLANVELKYVLNESNEFSLEHLYFNGKFTTRGTSFNAHREILQKLQKKYSEKIQEIEDNYIIKYETSNDNWYLSGEPIIFKLSNCLISDINLFCDKIFSGKPPFRLFGIPRETLSSEGRTVLATDFHNGGKLFFEIYPDIICMYLSSGACGNTAIRFFTNLQRHFSKLVQTDNGYGSSIF
jgi:hypothetical protein